MGDPASSTTSVPSTRPASGLADSVAALREDLRPDAVVDAPWRWRMRRHLGAVRDALVAEGAASQDAALAARTVRADRSRHPLLRDVGRLARRLLEDADAEPLRRDLARLATDLDHHAQRRRDLAYDEVEMELGGSE